MNEPQWRASGAGTRWGIEPRGTCHLTAPAFRSTAVSAPHGGGVQIPRLSRLMAYGVPRCRPYSRSGRAMEAACRLSRGIKRTIMARRLVGATRMPRRSSTDTPDQFMPPRLPGQMIVPWSEGGVNTPW